MATDLLRIRARRRSVADEMSRAEQTIAALKIEDQELAVAERVIGRLVSGDVEKGTERLVADITPVKTPKGSKPPDIPTVPQMILAVLRDAASANGKIEMAPSEVTSMIGKRWWPDVPVNAIGPIMWRMWKRGELEYGDGRWYSLPKSQGQGDA